MIWFIIVGALFVFGGFSQIFSNFSNGAVMIIVGAALIFWGLRNRLLPMIFDKIKKKTEADLTIETFYLAGIVYYIDNIKKLAYCNPAWKYTVAKATSKGMLSKRIYRYYYANKPVKLVPEPNNPHDENAIAVYFAGKLVGYIKKEDNKHILDILKSRDVKYISGFIGGGDYKVVTTDGQFLKESDSLHICVRIAYK